MKKIVLFLAVALSINFAQAQTGPRIGLKAGANYSNISGDLQDEDIYENKIGFVGGLTANFPLMADGFLSLQPELLYSQKGYQYRDQEFSVGPNTFKRQGHVNYNYLDLPVVLRVNAGGLFFEGGPQASYLLGIRDKTEETNPSGTYESKSVISKDNLSEFEIGYVAGLGYQTANGLSLNLRYNGSINSLAKNNNDRLENARHSAIQLTLGFMIPGR